MFSFSLCLGELAPPCDPVSRSAPRFLVLAEDASAEDAPSDDDVPELDSAAGETVPLEPSADVSGFSDKVVENGDVFQQMFAEATSQNSGVANE